MHDATLSRQDDVARWMWWLLACILAAAAALRFYDLAGPSLWFDEAVSLEQSSDGFIELIRRTAADNYPPLHNLVLWPVVKLFGTGEFAIRAPSPIFSTLTVAAVFLFGRELAGARAGLIAAMILAVMPLEIEFAHHARMYALFSLTVTAYLWGLARYIRRPSPSGAVLASLALLAMLYTHVYGLFVWAGASAAWIAQYLFRRHVAPADFWRLVRWHAAAFLLFLPWLVVFAFRAEEISHWAPWRPYPDVRHLWRTLLSVFPAPSLVFVSLLLAAGAVRALVLRDTPRRLADTVAIVAAAVVAPVLIGYVISVTFKPLLIDRYLIFAGPACLVVAAAILVHLPVPRLVPWLAAAVTVAALAGPAMDAARGPGLHRDWRALVAAWQAERAPEDGLVIYPFWASRVFEYYYGRKADVMSLPYLLPDALKPVDFHGHLWIAIRDDDPAVADEIAAAYLAAGYEREQVLDFHRLRLLELARP